MFIMNERFCKKCNHLCHCIEADHEGCKCDGCECKAVDNNKEYASDLSFENNGELVIDSTDDCESCQ
jgi:hypothetical protein